MGERKRESERERRREGGRGCQASESAETVRAAKIPNTGLTERDVHLVATSLNFPYCTQI